MNTHDHLDIPSNDTLEILIISVSLDVENFILGESNNLLIFFFKVKA